MVTAKIDIDNDDPYSLARQLMTLANYRCAIRLSSKKGAHLKIFDLSEATAYSIKTRLDDLFRVQLDEARARDGIDCTSVLWDRKNGTDAGAWIEWRTKALGLWLLHDSSRSLRDAIINLFNMVMHTEFESMIIHYGDKAEVQEFYTK